MNRYFLLLLVLLVSLSSYSQKEEKKDKKDRNFRFAGIAAAVPDIKGLFENTYLPLAGVGVRFILIKRMGINIGIDVGVGRDDWSLTFRVGEAFSR